jgi:hypothetical protein
MIMAWRAETKSHHVNGVCAQETFFLSHETIPGDNPLVGQGVGFNFDILITNACHRFRAIGMRNVNIRRKPKCHLDVGRGTWNGFPPYWNCTTFCLHTGPSARGFLICRLGELMIQTGLLRPNYGIAKLTSRLGIE